MVELNESIDTVDWEEERTDTRFKWVVGSALFANAFLAPALFLFTMYGLMMLPAIVTLGLTIVAFVMVRYRCMEAWNSDEKPWMLLSGTIAFGLLFMYGLVWISVLVTKM